MIANVLLPPARVEMAPAHEVLVVAPPRAHLVRGVADQAGRAALLHRLPVARGRRRIAQHEPAADVFPFVVAGRGAAADVDQLRGHVGALAVVGHGQAHVVDGGDPARPRGDLVERAAVHAPAAIAAERAEVGGAVAGERLHVHVAQAERLGATHHVFDRVVEPRRRGTR